MSTADKEALEPPTFTFKNIGPIKNAKLELGDLTVIAGRNNTGKTYLVYTLYGFLNMWETWPGVATASRDSGSTAASARPAVFEQILHQILERNEAVVAVDLDTLKRERTTTMRALTRQFTKDALSGVFSSPSEAFQGASMSVTLTPTLPQPPLAARGESRRSGLAAARSSFVH